MLMKGHVVQIADIGYAEERGVGFTGRTRRSGGKCSQNQKRAAALDTLWWWRLEIRICVSAQRGEVMGRF